MRYLIDTNILLWFIEDNNKLPSEISKILNNDKSSVYMSIVSLWEISIKHSIGKLKLPRSLEEIFTEVCDEDYFNILEIKPSHIVQQSKLPFHHRNPFDRLIYAQAITEDLTFLYTDEIFDEYKKGEQK